MMVAAKPRLQSRKGSREELFFAAVTGGAGMVSVELTSEEKPA